MSVRLVFSSEYDVEPRTYAAVNDEQSSVEPNDRGMQPFYFPEFDLMVLILLLMTPEMGRHWEVTHHNHHNGKEKNEDELPAVCLKWR